MLLCSVAFVCVCVCLSVRSVLVLTFESLDLGSSFLPKRDYVSFGYLLSQIRLLSVTFVRPTKGLKPSVIFLRHFVACFGHPLTCLQNFTEIVTGEPHRRGR